MVSLIILGDIDEHINLSVRICNSKNHYKELDNYLISPLVLLILEYLNSELTVWKFGFITKRFKTFDDIIVSGKQILKSDSSTVIYAKYIRIKVMPREIDLNWIDNFKKITKNLWNKVNSDEILCEEIKEVKFPLNNGIYKVTPISDTIITANVDFEIKDILIVKPIYLNIEEDYEIFNIQGKYILERYFFSGDIFVLIKEKRIPFKKLFH